MTFTRLGFILGVLLNRVTQEQVCFCKCSVTIWQSLREKSHEVRPKIPRDLQSLLVLPRDLQSLLAFGSGFTIAPRL